MHTDFRFCLIRPIKQTLLVLWLLFTGVSTSLASEDILEMGILQMTPYGYEDELGVKRGALYEIGQAIKGQFATNSIDVRILPGLRIVNSLGTDQLFCTIAANTPDLTSFGLIEPIGFSISAGILPKKGIELNEYEQLNAISIAVPDSVQFDTRFHNDTTLTKVNAPEYANAVEMLIHERVEAIAGGIQPILNAAKIRGYDSSIFGKPLTIFEADMYLICNQNLKEAQRSGLKETVIQLRESGAISAILNEYF